MTTNHRFEPPEQRRQIRGALALLRKLLCAFGGDSRGASTIEQVLIMAVALTGAVGFSKFGSNLHSQLTREAAHIEGKGMPANGDLMAPLTASFDTSSYGCNGAFCVPGSGRCFAAGTPVATEHGDRPIESIREGELVWARSESTGEVALRPVTQRFVTSDSAVIDVELRSARAGRELLSVTATHRFWVDARGWTPAAELGADALWSPAGALSAQAESSRSELVTVYNLEVSEFHSYFVGRSHALVHNGDGTGVDPIDCASTTSGNAAGAVSGGTAATAPTTPATSTTPPAGRTFSVQLSADQEARRQACEEKLGASTVPYKKNTRATPRPGDAARAVYLLCLEMALRCSADLPTETCVNQWDCIFDYVARQHRTEYFHGLEDEIAGGLSTTAGADDGTEAKKSAGERARDAARGQCLGDQIRTWACKKSAIAPPTRPFPPSTVTTTPVAGPTPRDPTVSNAAGDEAAENFYRANYGKAPWKCVDTSPRGGVHAERGGANVFDVVCWNSTTNEAVIIEAKGGGNTLGTRQNEDKSGHVEQGTMPYALSILAAITASGRGGGQEVAEAVQAAIDDNHLRYFLVRQEFDAHGNPLAPGLEEFDLQNPDSSCRKCNCN
jgi:hypothetical protein